MKCHHGADKFIERYFYDCVYNTRDYVGFVLGLTAIVLWVLAQLPQFITNYKNKSAEALSPWFLAQWLLGDTFNLLGCLVQGEQLPTTTYTAMYFVLSDAIMMMQYVYYGALQKRRAQILLLQTQRRRHHRHHHHPHAQQQQQQQQHRSGGGGRQQQQQGRSQPQPQPGCSGSGYHAPASNPRQQQQQQQQREGSGAPSLLHVHPHPHQHRHARTSIRAAAQLPPSVAAAADALPPAAERAVGSNEQQRQLDCLRPRPCDAGAAASSAEQPGQPLCRHHKLCAEDEPQTQQQEQQQVCWQWPHHSPLPPPQREQQPQPQPQPQPQQQQQLCRQGGCGSRLRSSSGGSCRTTALPRATLLAAGALVALALPAAVCRWGGAALPHVGSSSSSSSSSSNNSSSSVQHTRSSWQAWAAVRPAASMYRTGDSSSRSSSSDSSWRGWQGGEHTGAAAAAAAVWAWLGSKDVQVLVGTCIGYAASLLYLSSRVSQIHKNYTRKSAEGLALGMFLLAVCANLCTGTGILLRATGWDDLQGQFPWVIGTLGTISLDIIILWQSSRYNRLEQQQHQQQEGLAAVNGAADTGVAAAVAGGHRHHGRRHDRGSGQQSSGLHHRAAAEQEPGLTAPLLRVYVEDAA